MIYRPASYATLHHLQSKHNKITKVIHCSVLPYTITELSPKPSPTQTTPHGPGQHA